MQVHNVIHSCVTFGRRNTSFQLLLVYFWVLKLNEKNQVQPLKPAQPLVFTGFFWFFGLHSGLVAKRCLGSFRPNIVPIHGRTCCTSRSSFDNLCYYSLHP